MTSEIRTLPAGPSAEDAAIGPVWISACAKGDSLVGARMLQAGGISGVVAICAPLNSSPEGLAWGAEPQAVKGPPVPPPPVMVTRNVSHQLRGRIDAGSSLLRTCPDGRDIIGAFSDLWYSPCASYA